MEETGIYQLLVVRFELFNNNKKQLLLFSHENVFAKKWCIISQIMANFREKYDITC